MLIFAVFAPTFHLVDVPGPEESASTQPLQYVCWNLFGRTTLLGFQHMQHFVQALIAARAAGTNARHVLYPLLCNALLYFAAAACYAGLVAALQQNLPYTFAGWYIIGAVETYATIGIALYWNSMDFNIHHLVDRLMLLIAIVFGEGGLGLAMLFHTLTNYEILHITPEVFLGFFCAFLISFWLAMMFYTTIDVHAFDNRVLKIWTGLVLFLAYSIVNLVSYLPQLVAWLAVIGSMRHVVYTTNSALTINSVVHFMTKDVCFSSDSDVCFNPDSEIHFMANNFSVNMQPEYQTMLRVTTYGDAFDAVTRLPDAVNWGHVANIFNSTATNIVLEHMEHGGGKTYAHGLESLRTLHNSAIPAIRRGGESDGRHLAQGFANWTTNLIYNNIAEIGGFHAPHSDGEEHDDCALAPLGLFNPFTFNCEFKAVEHYPSLVRFPAAMASAFLGTTLLLGTCMPFVNRSHHVHDITSFDWLCSGVTGVVGLGFLIFSGFVFNHSADSTLNSSMLLPTACFFLMGTLVLYFLQRWARAMSTALEQFVPAGDEEDEGEGDEGEE